MKRARRMGLHPRHDLSNPTRRCVEATIEARRPWECLPSQEKQKASRPIATRGFVSAWLPFMSRSTTGVERVQRHELRIQRR